MDLQADSQLLRNFTYSNLVDYLKITGWHLSSSSNQRWKVFEGVLDFYGDPLEIILPQDVLDSDISHYLANAVNMLSSLFEDDPEIVSHNIQFYNRDILRIRNTETGEKSSISLSLAAQQVPQLKNLVAYAACSEVDPVPSHINARKTAAKTMVKHYQFGHTFKGSFGYTVESPVSEDLHSHEGIFKKDVRYLPFERRVMERIVRGLFQIKTATETRDAQVIIDGYGEGLNSNMCKSLVKMSPDHSTPIEYLITWSPLLAPSEDIKKPEPILITETSFEHLKYAATMLEQLEPKEITITGFVKELKTDDNPLGTDTSRTVLIDVTTANDDIPSRVSITLGKDDYQKALDAHGDWLPVTIKGILQRRYGSRWYIVKYSSFVVTPKLL